MLFWFAIGLVVMTGIGNLGVFGVHIPAPTYAWGTMLSIKLVAVAVLILGSLIRTLLVCNLLANRGRQLNQNGRKTLKILYCGTATLTSFILLLAISLAHGG